MKLEDKKKTIRENILEVARERMLKKGFSQCTVKEIAKAAGLTEPTLYQYFTNKEDILFSAVYKTSADASEFCNEQVQGIQGGYNKLRKLIWAHLRWNDLHKKSVALSFLECRTNENFYSSDAYKTIKEYSRIFKGFLNEAIEEGTIRSDININLVRDIILGLIDYEGYSVAISNEKKDSVSDHDDIMKMLDRMLIKKYNNINNTPKDKKKLSIIDSATHLFAQKGYAKTSISDISSQAKISDGSVYEYFKNKEDLLLSIPEERFNKHLEELREYEKGNYEKKLHQFIHDHFRFYLEDRNFFTIFLRLIHLNRRFIKSRAYESLNIYTNALESIVQEGINQGHFATDCNIKIFKNMFWGAFIYLGLRWFIINVNQNLDKYAEVCEFANLMLDSIRGQNKS